jgi:hypothetical protein
MNWFVERAVASCTSYYQECLINGREVFMNSDKNLCKAPNNVNLLIPLHEFKISPFACKLSKFKREVWPVVSSDSSMVSLDY